MITTINNMFDNLFYGHEIKIFTPQDNIIANINAGELIAKLLIFTAIIYIAFLGIRIIYKLVKL